MVVNSCLIYFTSHIKCSLVMQTTAQLRLEMSMPMSLPLSYNTGGANNANLRVDCNKSELVTAMVVWRYFAKRIKTHCSSLKKALRSLTLGSLTSSFRARSNLSIRKLRTVPDLSTSPQNSNKKWSRTYTPFSNMAENTLFFCFHVNWPSWPRSHLQKSK